MKLLLATLLGIVMKIQNESTSVIVDLAMTHRRVRYDVEQHKMKKQVLKTGCYQISQIKRLSVVVIASNSPKEVFFRLSSICHPKLTHSDLFTELSF